MREPLFILNSKLSARPESPLVSCKHTFLIGAGNQTTNQPIPGEKNDMSDSQDGMYSDKSSQNSCF